MPNRPCRFRDCDRTTCKFSHPVLLQVEPSEQKDVSCVVFAGKTTSHLSLAADAPLFDNLAQASIWIQTKGNRLHVYDIRPQRDTSMTLQRWCFADSWRRARFMPGKRK